MSCLSQYVSVFLSTRFGCNLHWDQVSTRLHTFGLSGTEPGRRPQEISGDRNFLSWESTKYSMELETFWGKEIRAKRQTVDITRTKHAKVPSGSLAKGIKYKKLQNYCRKVPSWICILHHLTISDPSLSLPSLLEITGHSTEHCHSRTLQGVWPKIDNLQSLKLVVLSTSATKASWMEVVEHLNHANWSTKTSRNKLAFNENTFEAFGSHPFHSV